MKYSKIQYSKWLMLLGLKFWVLAFFIFYSGIIKAQDPLPIDGEIEDAQVIIEKDRKIVLPFAQRFYEKISDQYKPQPSERLNFGFFDWDFTPQQMRMRFTAREFNAKEADKNAKNEIRLGFGNYISPLAKINLTSAPSTKYMLGMDFDHLSFVEGAVDGENSGAGTTGLAVNGKYMSETYTIVGRVNYNTSFGHFYGYDPSLEVGKDSIKQIFNEFGITLGLDGKPSDNVSYDVRTGFNLIKDNFSASESKANLEAKIQFVTESNLRAGIALEGVISKYETAMFASNRNIYRAKPKVLFTTNQLTVGIGAKVVMLADTTYLGNDFNVYPDITLDYEVSHQFNVFASVKGDVKEMYFDQVSRDNFFVAENLDIRHGNQQFEARAGVSGGNNKLGFEFFVGYEQLQYQSFFVNSLFDSTRFAIIYDTAANTVLKTNLKIHYNAGSVYRGSINATYYNYNTKSVAQAWHRPELEISMNNHIRINDKINFTANVFALGGIRVVENINTVDSYFSTEGQATPPASVALPMIVDVSLQIDYAIDKKWGAFISGDNLMNSNYQRFLNYANRGIMAKIGIKYAF